MAYKLSIKSVKAYANKENGKLVEYTLKELQRRVKNGSLLVDSYSSYYPQFDFSRDVLARKTVGYALGEIWEYCIGQEIALLNFLVVCAASDLPGSGMMKYYLDLYGCLAGYDIWCQTSAEFAKYCLENYVIEIVD